MITLAFHQSWLKDYLLCPERARAKWFGEVVDGPTDATAIGTGLHAHAESVIRGCYEEEAREEAYKALAEEIEHEHFQWKQVKTAQTALRHLDQAIDNWMIGVLPQIGTPFYVEQPFEIPFAVVPSATGDDVQAVLAGTIDFADESGPWDWKTGKDDLERYREGWNGKGWELKRWGIQPTTYCTAAYLLGELDEPWNFTFGAVSKNKRSWAILPTPRNETYIPWLRQLIANATKMLTSPLDEWPKNDNHALCSELWCPNYARCRGNSSMNVPLTVR